MHTSASLEKKLNELAEKIERYHQQLDEADREESESDAELMMEDSELHEFCSVKCHTLTVSCAVERRLFSVGAKPTQQLSLRLVAIRAVYGGNDMD